MSVSLMVSSEAHTLSFHPDGPSFLLIMLVSVALNYILLSVDLLGLPFLQYK
jgi:hypothetical protein